MHAPYYLGNVCMSLRTLKRSRVSMYQ